MSELEIKSGVAELVSGLEAGGARVYVPRGDRDYAVGAGLRMLTLRHLVNERDGLYAARAGEEAMLRYYANSIAHLLGAEAASDVAAASRPVTDVAALRTRSRWREGDSNTHPPRIVGRSRQHICLTRPRPVWLACDAPATRRWFRCTFPCERRQSRSARIGQGQGTRERGCRMAPRPTNDKDAMRDPARAA